MPKRKRGKFNSATSSEKAADGATSSRSSHVHHVVETSNKNKSQKKHLRKVQATLPNKNERSSQSLTEKHSSKKKMKVMSKNEKLSTAPSSHNTKSPTEEILPSKAASSSFSSSRLDLANGTRPKSALQQEFLSRLAGSRFRKLNEELYTTNSSEAFERFQSNPGLFNQYHEGFRTQVKSWPVNPADAVYRWILSIHKKRLKDNKRTSQLVVADFGCGDAKLAQKLLKIKQEQEGRTHHEKDKTPMTCPFCVHSFDLVANGNEHITPCDMANVPLQDGVVDVAVFVLALMGTNIADFIREAHRVLKSNGVLKIAEVRSRFESASTSDRDQSRDPAGQGFGSHGCGVGKTNWKQSSNKKTDDSLLNEFLSVMLKLGFKCTQKDRNNKMFILLEFEKTGRKPSK
eukprot:CAMPEP_0176498712 /NCGR_PEP_ID=MMETSP0200_2-20121128/12485_1 /TAXON_ID=947934 /ORGANISM="Chaetoceros sp., Strain GSL56" /LENGTH=401 /DNA_ID=CAMNT_0017896973 /DNA_START=72 /DNA_END=1274 /DNA_ORIENTATION=+